MTASPNMDTDKDEGIDKPLEKLTSVTSCTEGISSESIIPPAPGSPAPVKSHDATTSPTTNATSNANCATDANTDTTALQAKPPAATPAPPAPGIAASTSAASADDTSTQASPTQASPTQASPTQASPTLGSPTSGSPTSGSPTSGSPTSGSPTSGSPAPGSPAPGPSALSAVVSSLPAAFPSTPACDHNNAQAYFFASPSKASFTTYVAGNTAEALTDVTCSAATESAATETLAPADAPPANPPVAASTGPVATAEKAKSTAPSPVVASLEAKAIPWPHVTIFAKALLAEAKVMEWIRDHGKEYCELQFAYDYLPSSDTPKVHIVRPEDVSNTWFIGDVHGDILALDAALEYIDTRSGPKPTIIFLGDLFDRFAYGKEVLMRVIDLIISHPGKIMWLAGNHDDALTYKDGQFSSNSRPDEFAQWLNENQEKYADFGHWLIGLCQLLPRALFFDDGLCVVHGGCPSFDMSKGRYLIDDIKDRKQLEQKDILHAFVWNRVIPDQLDKSQDEVGKNDLIHFFQHMSMLLDIPVKRMLRGHDHCRETRFAHSDFYQPEAPVLTMVTMSAWYLGSKSSAPELAKSLRKKDVTTPAIAKYRRNDLPEVLTLQIPHEMVAQFHTLESLDDAHTPTSKEKSGVYAPTESAKA